MDRSKGFSGTIRRATNEDMDDLTRISRLGFPRLLRWRGPKFHTRKWWRMLLDDGYCEMRVCVNDEQVVGFCALIFDRAKYEKVWRRHRPGLLAGLYMFATCPKLFIMKAIAKSKRYATKTLLRSAKSLPAGNEPPASERLMELFSNPSPWVGPVAVLPIMQGRGIATEMFKFCLQRAIELGYEEIQTYAELSNTKSIGLLNKLGFVKTQEVHNLAFYRKTLTEKAPLGQNFIPK